MRTIQVKVLPPVLDHGACFFPRAEPFGVQALISAYIPHIGKGICPQFPALGGSCQRSARYWASGTPRSWSIWICRGLKLGSKTRTAVLEANKV